jgi:hypothetical protein
MPLESQRQLQLSYLHSHCDWLVSSNFSDNYHVAILVRIIELFYPVDISSERLNGWVHSPWHPHIMYSLSTSFVRSRELWHFLRVRISIWVRSWLCLRSWSNVLPVLVRSLLYSRLLLMLAVTQIVRIDNLTFPELLRGSQNTSVFCVVAASINHRIHNWVASAVVC